MLTLKFYKNLKESGQQIEDVISAPRYEKHTMPCGSKQIIVHTQGDEPNIEYKLNSSHQETNSFEFAYIENASGKTIARESYEDKAYLDTK